MATRSTWRSLRMTFALLLPVSTGVFASPEPGPTRHGLMQGFPPAAEQRVKREATMFASFNRWAFRRRLKA